jgi:hypothetical protein
MRKTIAHLGVIDIMDLIKDDEFNISNQISSLVEHTSQNLGRHLPISYCRDCATGVAHNQTTSFGIDLHISSQNTNGRGVESSFEISKFLIRKRFNWRGVDCPKYQLVMCTDIMKLTSSCVLRLGQLRIRLLRSYQQRYGQRRIHYLPFRVDRLLLSGNCPVRRGTVCQFVIRWGLDPTYKTGRLGYEFVELSISSSPLICICYLLTHI